MIGGIHHVALHTPHIERMLDFYCNVLGFEVALDHALEKNQLIDEIIGMPGSIARLVMLPTGNCHLELLHYLAPEPRHTAPLRPHNHGYTNLCLDVTDIEAEFDRLTAAGTEFCRRPGDFGDVKAVYGRDPDGNIIEIQETTPGSSRRATEVEVGRFVAWRALGLGEISRWQQTAIKVASRCEYTYRPHILIAAERLNVVRGNVTGRSELTEPEIQNTLRRELERVLNR